MAKGRMQVVEVALEPSQAAFFRELGRERLRPTDGSRIQVCLFNDHVSVSTVMIGAMDEDGKLMRVIEITAANFINVAAGLCAYLQQHGEKIGPVTTVSLEKPNDQSSGT